MFVKKFVEEKILGKKEDNKKGGQKVTSIKNISSLGNRAYFNQEEFYLESEKEGDEIQMNHAVDSNLFNSASGTFKIYYNSSFVGLIEFYGELNFKPAQKDGCIRETFKMLYFKYTSSTEVLMLIDEINYFNENIDGGINLKITGQYNLIKNLPGNTNLSKENTEELLKTGVDDTLNLVINPFSPFNLVIIEYNSSLINKSILDSSFNLFSSIIVDQHI